MTLVTVVIEQNFSSVEYYTCCEERDTAFNIIWQHLYEIEKLYDGRRYKLAANEMVSSLSHVRQWNSKLNVRFPPGFVESCGVTLREIIFCGFRQCINQMGA
jgi:hypothetical protein